MSSPTLKPIRTLTIAHLDPSTRLSRLGPLSVAFARKRPWIILLNTNPGEDPTIVTFLSVLADDDPFPGTSEDGHELIWVR